MQKKLNRMVNLLSHIKNRELMDYKEKVSYLKVMTQTNPSNKVYALRHKIAKERFDNLILTTLRLKYLEQDVKKLNKDI
ncbi:hypothetical protein [Aestuariivivens marinum]|uniref:hypothetical protein n=1 Tax=Aestuariivivens marinum TaxID=2913555 RepID=UPI001F5AFE6D|nr:hypothetical protein [Aestuariivivens marinum]